MLVGEKSGGGVGMRGRDSYVDEGGGYDDA